MLFCSKLVQWGQRFIEIHRQLARLVWRFQERILRFLTEEDGIILACGLAGTVYVQRPQEEVWQRPSRQLSEKFRAIEDSIDQEKARELLSEINTLKEPQNLFYLWQHSEEQQQLRELAQKLNHFAGRQLSILQKRGDDFSTEETERVIRQNNVLLDSAWAIDKEILDIIEDSCQLLSIDSASITYKMFCETLAIASVLRGLDKKLETRGRDSCGLSIMLVLRNFPEFTQQLREEGLHPDFIRRQQTQDLGNLAIDLQEREQSGSITFTYKVAKAIGQLGDNVHQLREYLKHDRILCTAIRQDYQIATTIVHTRWASQGVVSIENCHPLDNKGLYFSPDSPGKYEERVAKKSGHIYAVLNGDIDNHLELRERYEKQDSSRKISDKITTDAKIIAITIEYFLLQGHSLEQAFLKSVNEFRGSFAIEMHSDIEPGKIYLAQQGKGQGLYLGISPYGYHIASETYGFVEQTSRYIPMKPGQICILDDKTRNPGELGIRSLDFHGTPIRLTIEDILETPITTRDVFLDTKKHSHFLQKEIHESPEIIAKTVRGKWKRENGELYIRLGKEILPNKICDKIANCQYRQILFIGMGTAHAAAEAIAAMFRSILGDHSQIQFASILATEFTAVYQPKNRSDTLVIAISQSGGTTDTNAAIRKLAEDQADILGIVNKRDSDMTFLIDGVLYTGDGRDIEIAVASTKAFYAQVVAGTLYALAFAQILGVDRKLLNQIIEELLQLPEKLTVLFTAKEKIAHSASDLAPKHIYWDTLSTGIGQPVATEIKIKLSELCYMSIPEFFAANKKHINLSAEALILCFFGALEQSNTGTSLAKDLQGEISIFLAQKNIPVVFTTTEDNTFDDIIPSDRHPSQLLKVIPPVSPYLSVILNTAAGHLWAYYAAKALNARSEFFAQILESLSQRERELRSEGAESFKILQDKKFHNIASEGYQRFHKMLEDGVFTNGLFAQNAIKLERLFLLAMKVVPTSAVPLLFGKDWGAETILRELKVTLTYLRTWLARSIDAIKHQAKYITVGVTGFEGIANMPTGKIKDAFSWLLQKQLITLDQEDLNEYDLITLSNIQPGIGQIDGGLLYTIVSQDDEIHLQVIPGSRFGESIERPSRYDSQMPLRGGRKAMAIQSDRVHIGRGHDQRKAIIIPLRSLGRISKLLVLRFEANEQLSGQQKVQILGGAYTRDSKAERILTLIKEDKEELMSLYKFSSEIDDEELLSRALADISVEDLLMLPHEDISERIVTWAQSYSVSSVPDNFAG